MINERAHGIRILLLCILFVWLLIGAAIDAISAPFVVSDPAPLSGPQPTHCGVWIDTAARAETAVSRDATGAVFCKIDVGAVAAGGSHTVRASFIVRDSVWGSLESAQSPPFVFARPSLPAAPAGLGLAP